MKKKKANSQPQILSPENYIRQKSRNLSIGKCYITEGWQEDKMAQIIIVREHVTGNVTVCFYLVDLGCLGVKDTMFKFNIPFNEIEEHLKYQKDEGAVLLEIPYELAHNIMYASVAYAEEYGFKPHKDFTSITRHFLEEDTDDIPLIDIECGGKDGKPLYVNTGIDSPVRVKQIISQLEKTAGQGNYHFIIPGEDYEDEEDDDEEEEDEMVLEIEQMEKEEQKKKFFELAFKKETDYDPENDVKYLFILSNILSYNLVSIEEVQEQFEVFREKFDIENVEEEELPNSLFTDVQHMDGETIADIFFDAIEKIENRKNPKKEIAAIRKEEGDIPVVDMLELMYLRQKNTRKYQQKLIEASQKYPNYLPIRLYYIIWHAEREEIRGYEEQLCKALSDAQKPVTLYEINTYFIFYAASLITDINNACTASILAFEQYLEYIDLLESDTFTRIISITTMAKIKMLCAHFEKTGELKQYADVMKK
jgi:hypothetical protein